MTKTKNNRFGKLIPVVLVIVFLVCLAVFMTACDGNNGADGVGIASAVINDAGELVITYTDGNIQNLGKIVGDNGTPGSTGNGIESITVDEEGMLVIEFTDGTSERFELPSPSVEECSHDNSETIVILMCATPRT